MTTDQVGRHKRRERHLFPFSAIELFELDLVIDNQIQARLTEGQCDFGRQLLLAGQAAFRESLPYRVLDLALRGDSTFLRNFRTLMLKTSSFMVPPYGSGPLKDKAGVRLLPRVSHS